jgi:histone H3/H4
VLVIASRLKSYVRERFGFNTSDAVLDVLSDELRRLCAQAAQNAREEGRKTVLDRDFAFLRSSTSSR